MDYSRGLITRIVDDGVHVFGTVKREGITKDFLDEDNRSIFSYIERFYSNYKDVPSRDAVQKQFPSYSFGSYKEPPEFFIESLKESFRRNILEESIESVANIYTKNTKEAESVLRECLSGLYVTQKSHKDISITETVADRIQAYETRKENPGVDGIASGWPSLDNQTLGWHPEEFVVCVGEKYMGKSWTMIWLSQIAAFQNKRVLFVTNEMSQDQVVRRFDSIYAQVPFDSLRKGELTSVEEQRYKDKMAELGDSNIHYVVARQGIQTIEDIQAKAIEVNADIIFGDSIYLFDPSEKGNWQGETAKRLEISRKCKQIAKELGVPFVVSVQAGRKKNKTKKGNRIPSLDDIEWSNAFSQDADTVFFVHKDDLDKELKRAQIYLLKSRDGDTTEFFIDQNFENMLFEEKKGEKMSPTTNIEFDDEELDYDEGA